MTDYAFDSEKLLQNIRDTGKKKAKDSEIFVRLSDGSEFKAQATLMVLKDLEVIKQGPNIKDKPKKCEMACLLLGMWNVNELMQAHKAASEAAMTTAIENFVETASMGDIFALIAKLDGGEGELFKTLFDKCAQASKKGQQK